MGKLTVSFAATLFVFCAAALALPPALPFTVYGQVLDEFAPVAGASVTIINNATGESLNASTDSGGWYVANLGNLDGGSDTSDIIVVEAELSDKEGISSAARLSESPQRIDVSIAKQAPDTDYPIEILEVKILDSDDNTATTIDSGTMYKIRVRNINHGSIPFSVLQIVQIGDENGGNVIPLNLGSVEAVMASGAISEITVGFNLPQDMELGTICSVEIFNWNDWASESGGGIPLSEPYKTTFNVS